MRALPGCRRRAFLDRRRDTVASPPPVRSVRFRSAVGPRPRAVTCRRHTDGRVETRTTRLTSPLVFYSPQCRHFDGFVSEPATIPPLPRHVPPDSRLSVLSGSTRLRSTHGRVLSFSLTTTEFFVVSSSVVRRFGTCRKNRLFQISRGLWRSRVVQKNVKHRLCKVRFK